MTTEIADEIQAAQDHGRQKYAGSPDNFTHDDRHEPDEWAAFIIDHAKRAADNTPMNTREHFIKVAGLAVSAVESIDRKAAARQAAVRV